MPEPLHLLRDPAGYLVPLLRGVSDGLWQRVWARVMAAWTLLPRSVRGDGICHSVRSLLASRLCSSGKSTRKRSWKTG